RRVVLRRRATRPPPATARPVRSARPLAAVDPNAAATPLSTTDASDRATGILRLERPPVGASRSERLLRPRLRVPTIRCSSRSPRAAGGTQQCRQSTTRSMQQDSNASFPQAKRRRNLDMAGAFDVRQPEQLPLLWLE